MTNYVLEEGRRLIERQKELGDLDVRFQESLGLTGHRANVETSNRTAHSPQQTWGDKEFDLPEAIYSDGLENW